ncbi:hypothetical protein PISMIDRAFT_682379 [Pisolithus microcarpus 441]|uniref:Uncharacterized protein n=1 Tax=Pisolithus microcarpus 441 TaxID=765257 RepID=A0A0C9YU79_9AGAM|nr:hypothetical protein PISMIDRAFT_682379 [Pisolithus microcarpus 441]
MGFLRLVEYVSRRDYRRRDLGSILPPRQGDSGRLLKIPLCFAVDGRSASLANPVRKFISVDTVERLVSSSTAQSFSKSSYFPVLTSLLPVTELASARTQPPESLSNAS